MVKDRREQQQSDSIGNSTSPKVRERTGFLLPFVGRESVLSEVLEFVHTALTGHQLSLLWIEGEAGIGKSRLLEEVLQRTDESVVVLQTRYNPDSRTSLSKLLFSALHPEEETKDFNRPLPSTGLPEILGEIRTAARLNPLLLIIEDVHLLDARTMTEMVTVLHGLEQESLGVICTARPSNETVYGAVLPFVIHTIQLGGFSMNDLQALGKFWKYDLKQKSNLLHFLHQNTHGIPLVVQSVINDFLYSADQRKQNPTATVRRIAQDTRLSLTLGLTRGLSDQDLKAAEQFATLGKIFSSHEAAILLDNVEDIIHHLCESGVLIRSHRGAEPLYGKPSGAPRYEFSHSLLHEHFLSQAPPPSDKNLEILLSDTPVYSTVPFVYIADIIIPPEEWEKLHHIIQYCIRIVDELINSPDWEIASVILNVAWKLYQNHKEALPEEKKKPVYTELLQMRLRTLNAFPAHQDFIEAADELMTLTRDPQTPVEAEQRLFALEYSLYRTDVGWTFRADEVFRETETLVSKFPAFLLNKNYLSLLGNIAGAMRASSPIKAIEGVRKRFAQIITRADEENDVEARRITFLDIAPNFIPLFQTADELQDSQELAERILQEYSDDIPGGRFATSWPRFLEMTGQAYRAREILKEWASHPISGYNLSHEFALRLLEILTNAAIEPNLDTIASWCYTLLKEFRQLQQHDESTGKASLAQTAIAAHVIVSGVMRGEVQWAQSLALELCNNSESITHYMEFERAALTHDLPQLERLIETNNVTDIFLPLVTHIINPSEGSHSEAQLTARNILLSPILQRHDILSQRIVLALLLAYKQPVFTADLAESMYQGISNGLQWLAERHLSLYARPLLEQAEQLLDKREYERVAALFSEKKDSSEKALESAQTTSSDDTPTIRISMLGEMTITQPDKSAKKIRGSRMKHALAALTANALAETPLSLAHFRTVATETEDPEESASYLRILISRLRKQLGKEGITTDGKNAPQLNTELVKVDLIDATEYLQSGLDSIRAQNPRHAYNALNEALNLLSKGDPYPGLDDEFFEATRKELKNRFRHGVLLAAEMLRKHGDNERAGTLLEHALTIFIEDEELLQQQIASA